MTRRLVLAALLVVGVGCADPSPESAEALPPSAEPGVAPRPEARPDSIPSGFTVRGVYLGAVHDSAAAAVSHEAISGFMGAMRMQIRVADRAELRGLRAGDKIRFRLADPDGNGYRMDAIEPLPPETPLVLADTAEAAVPEEESLPAAADSAR